MSTAADRAAVDFLRDVTLCLALNAFREGAAGVRRGRFPLTWFRLKVVCAPLQVVMSTAADRAAVDFLRDVTLCLALNAFREGAAGVRRGRFPLTWFRLKVVCAPLQVVMSTAADRAAVDFLRVQRRALCQTLSGRVLEAGSFSERPPPPPPQFPLYSFC